MKDYSTTQMDTDTTSTSVCPGVLCSVCVLPSTCAARCDSDLAPKFGVSELPALLMGACCWCLFPGDRPKFFTRVDLIVGLVGWYKDCGLFPHT